MIHYRLRCDRAHEFEGWFRSSDSFDEQARRGLLSCPDCGTTRVDRGLMSPAVRTRRAASDAPDPAATGAAAPAGVGSKTAVAAQATPAEDTAAKRIPDAMRALLQRMRSEIERNCEDLGDGFAAEAIRMHHGEATPRGIYGNATEADREVLAEEGIDVVQIPWPKRAEG